MVINIQAYLILSCFTLLRSADTEFFYKLEANVASSWHVSSHKVEGSFNVRGDVGWVRYDRERSEHKLTWTWVTWRMMYHRPTGKTQQVSAGARLGRK